VKVLILSPALETAGGIQRYSAALIRAFKDLLGDGQVCCLALPEGNPGTPQSALSKSRYLWNAVRQNALCAPDLIICTHLSLGPIGWLIARLGGRPYWIVAHGIEAWVVLPRLKHAALRRADLVIVTSSFSREQLLERQGITPESLSRLPCAVDKGLWEIEPENESRLGFRQDQRVVLTVARMMASEKYKGHDVVLRSLPSVVSKVPALAYVIVGDGDDRERLERLAKDLGLDEHVLFTGSVPDPRLAAIYQRSEVFVLPSRTVIDDHDSKGEGFGIVFLEAMAYGKPVIGPDHGAPRELIRPGENGLLVDPENATSVADALLTLLSNRESARQMGEAGRKWVDKHYSYAAFRERLRQILDASTQVLRTLEMLPGAQPLKGSPACPFDGSRHISSS